MKIVAVTNNKGGVGKTHTVFHLSGALSDRGFRVLAIDLDPQANLTGLFLEPDQRNPGVFEVLAEDIPLVDAIHVTEFERISIVPASPKIQNIDALLQQEPDAQIRLADALKELADSGEAFDYVLLDCPPSLALPTRNALAAASSVLIPLEADKFSVEGLDRLVQSVETMRKVVNPQLAIAGILISLFKGRRTIENLYEQALRGKSLPIFSTVIKDSAKYREAITARKPITHYKPSSEFAEAFRQLSLELDEHAHAH